MLVSVVGIVGLPARYGGFETLVENLVQYWKANYPGFSVEVYCSGFAYPERCESFHGARLRYVPLNANGVSSILYDIWSLLSAAFRRSEVILVLGVSGAVALPFLRLFCKSRIITNIDGIEWRRPKWGALARLFLRLSERLAVQFSHIVIADNEGIRRYVREELRRDACVIAYGGDHCLARSREDVLDDCLPQKYALALCRIEPENNVHLVLEAFLGSSLPLVFVGNWSASRYGRELRERYERQVGYYLLDPVYEPDRLGSIRAGATLYVHGHSAGGTNPSLVEMMFFGCPIVAFNCEFNRFTTKEQCLFFDDAATLKSCVAKIREGNNQGMIMRLGEIAAARYTWEGIGREYTKLILQERCNEAC